jgi:ATP-dependent helicase/nuclease subunit A
MVKRTNAELLVVGMGDFVDEIPDAISEHDAAVAIPARPLPEPLMSIDEWETERDRALSIASRPTAVAATALSEEGVADTAADLLAGLQKRPRDADLPPWLKGRYGSAVGRAVHGTLQTIDLATGAGLDAAVAAQCQAEAIPDRADNVRFLVEAALRSPSVREAAALEHWREVYVCTPIGRRLLEGYIDLLYREPDGLVVVDYKTSASDDSDELDRRMLGYRLQGASYAVAVAGATGERVNRVTFLFLTPSGPVERELDDLDVATAEVRSLVEAGREIAVDELETAG